MDSYLKTQTTASAPQSFAPAFRCQARYSTSPATAPPRPLPRASAGRRPLETGVTVIGRALPCAPHGCGDIRRRLCSPAAPHDSAVHDSVAPLPTGSIRPAIALYRERRRSIGFALSNTNAAASVACTRRRSSGTRWTMRPARRWRSEWVCFARFARGSFFDVSRFGPPRSGGPTRRTGHANAFEWHREERRRHKALRCGMFRS
jgi:hypothetical protein